MSNYFRIMCNRVELNLSSHNRDKMSSPFTPSLLESQQSSSVHHLVTQPSYNNPTIIEVQTRKTEVQKETTCRDGKQHTSNVK